MEIKDLEAQISYYASKYYAGEPEISDEVFDALVDKLRKVNPNSEVLNTGWGFEVIEDKVRHKYSHIGSLDKCKTYESIPDIFKDKTVYISPKLDGLSAVAYYKNGKLIKGVTRGNGEVGKDITNKLICILGKTINDNHFTGAVRGELIINDINWKILNEKYNGLISPRNFSAGIINRKDIDEDIKCIDLVVYKVVGQEGGVLFKRRDEMLHWLKLNFDKVVPEYYYPVLNEPSWNTYHNETFETFKKLGYGLDGLVLTLPDIMYNRMTNGYTYTEVAYKFQAESTTTIVKDIEWTLSRTQRYVPVAIVEPVELSGAIVERATCNNAMQVKEWGLGKDAEVKIQRANEIIPYIMEVLNTVDINLPTNCPVCGSTLVWDGVDLKCDNDKCLNIEYSNLQQWCEVIGKTDGLQYTIMKQYLDKYCVSTISDLYKNIDFILNDLKSRKLSITEEKILEFFEKLNGKYSVLASDALIALNIPRLGEKTAKLLSKDSKLVNDLYHYSLDWEKDNSLKIDTTLYDRLYEVVKDATTVSILDNLNKFSNLKYICGENKMGLLFLNNTTEDIKYVAVTGSLKSMKRKDFEKLINDYGYELTSNLKKCEYLITNDPTSGSTKNKQAIEYGIEIITEENFLKSLHKN